VWRVVNSDQANAKRITDNGQPINASEYFAVSVVGLPLSGDPQLPGSPLFAVPANAKRTTDQCFRTFCSVGCRFAIVG
jgi:hypothetical protein